MNGTGRTGCAADGAAADGMAGGPPLWTRESVEAQIAEAIATLMALPDRERDWLMSCRARWPAAPAGRWDGGGAAEGRRRRPVPTPGAIDRMLPTLLWIRHLDEAGQRVLWMRGLNMSWARIGAEIGRTGQTARRWHGAALDLVAARLNRQLRQAAAAAAPGQPMGSVATGGGEAGGRRGGGAGAGEGASHP